MYRADGGYRLTDAGRDLAGVVRELGGWAMRWNRRELGPDDLDAGALVWDIRGRIVPDSLPQQRSVVQLRFREPQAAVFYLDVRRPTVTLCPEDIGLPVVLTVDADLDALTRCWIGELTWTQVVRSGAVELTGSSVLRRAFPTWFSGYVLRDAS